MSSYRYQDFLIFWRIPLLKVLYNSTNKKFIKNRPCKNVDNHTIFNFFFEAYILECKKNGDIASFKS